MDQSPPVNGTGPIIRGGSRQDTGPEGPRPRIHTRTATLDEELCEVSGGLSGRGEPDLLVDEDVDESH